jgi:hypothetical protein
MNPGTGSYCPVVAGNSTNALRWGFGRHGSEDSISEVIVIVILTNPYRDNLEKPQLSTAES